MVTAANAPKLPESAETRRHIRHVLAAQLFFFLRDIGHRHQHHDPNTDTIVDLYESTDQDDFYWKLRTLYALYRKIIVFKRVRERALYASSLGVLAYARTFRKIATANASEEEAARLPYFFDENVVASINAADMDEERRQSHRLASQGIVREMTLAALAILIAAIGVFQVTEYKVPVRPSDSLYFVAEMIITQPILSLVVVGVFIWAFLAFLGRWDVTRSGAVRFIFRLVQPFDIKVAIAVFALLAVTLFALLIFALLTFA
jgi:hypothetical protein